MEIRIKYPVKHKIVQYEILDGWGKAPDATARLLNFSSNVVNYHLFVTFVRYPYILNPLITEFGITIAA